MSIELLEEIKRNYNKLQAQNLRLRERVQEFEEKRDEWRDNSQSYMTNQELREQSKRYREALEDIRSMFPMRGGISYDKISQIRKIAEKALEAINMNEIKERLKEIEQKYDMWSDNYNLNPQDVEFLIKQAKSLIKK